MADIIGNLFGGSKSSATPAPTADADFADFAEEPSPTPAAPYSQVRGGATLRADGSLPSPTGAPYTKWYRLDERHSLNDFRIEFIILACLVAVLAIHFVGAALNRKKAKEWFKANGSTLSTEFASVGFDGVPTTDESGRDSEELTTTALKEKSLFEFSTYATGRQNVAFLDVKLSLLRRFNPLMVLVEYAMGLFIESAPTPTDSAAVTIYPFDGKEAFTVPRLPGSELKAKDSKSQYDGCVWAIVNKDKMKGLRDDRYDVSLTFTKDSPKLPNWLTVMSESAEITEALLTPELIQAAESAGDLFDWLIVSDQPIDKPTKLEETTPRKRIFLKYRLPSSNDYAGLVPILKYAIRLSDQLVRDARFRPEVLRKLKNTRDETIKQIAKVDEDEKSEERAVEREKSKKAKRDAELAALDAKGQKKYLEKEREKDLKKQQKKMTSRG